MKNNTLLIVVGLLAAGAAAFFFLKRTPTVAVAAPAPKPAMDSTQAYLEAGTSLFTNILDRL